MKFEKYVDFTEEIFTFFKAICHIFWIPFGRKLKRHRAATA